MAYCIVELLWVLDMVKLKINGLMDKPLWYKMKCTCKKGSVMQEHPVKTCLSCKYTIQEDSMPRNVFKIKDDKGKEIEIKEITINRGSHDDIIAWSWSY